MRRIPGHSFEKPAVFRGPALAFAAVLGLGCADGSTEIDAQQPQPPGAAVGVESVPANAVVAAPGAGRSEALFRRLREDARETSAGSVLALDERLRAAESEFPLEFRFSYERAKLAVFGRREHHEAFGRLRRAAEKAIETGRSEAMLEWLRRDGAQSGPFWKMARGHSEWHQILVALEHGDREAMWRGHHESEAAIRIAPDTHADTEALDASRAAVLPDELDRLRLVRARIGREEPSSDP